MGRSSTVSESHGVLTRSQALQPPTIVDVGQNKICLHTRAPAVVACLFNSLVRQAERDKQQLQRSLHALQASMESKPGHRDATAVGATFSCITSEAATPTAEPTPNATPGLQASMVNSLRRIDLAGMDAFFPWTGASAT